LKSLDTTFHPRQGNIPQSVVNKAIQRNPLLIDGIRKYLKQVDLKQYQGKLVLDLSICLQRQENNKNHHQNRETIQTEQDESQTSLSGQSPNTLSSTEELDPLPLKFSNLLESFLLVLITIINIPQAYPGTQLNRFEKGDSRKCCD